MSVCKSSDNRERIKRTQAPVRLEQAYLPVYQPPKVGQQKENIDGKAACCRCRCWENQQETQVEDGRGGGADWRNSRPHKSADERTSVAERSLVNRRDKQHPVTGSGT